MAKAVKVWDGTQWIELGIKAPEVSGLATTSALAAHESDTTNVHGIADTAQLATLSSPAFTGTPTAPTAPAATNTTQIATTAFVRTEVANIVDSAPSTLDTLNELAAALGDDPNFATTVTNSIADKVSKSGGDTITVSSGTTVPLTIQNNGTGNSFVVNDVASDTTPFVIDASGNVGVGTSSPQSLLDIKNGTTYSSSGSFLVKIQQNTNSPGSNGLSVMNAWAGTGSTIFEVAMGWNGSVAGYYPAFSIDGIGNITISNVTAGALRMKLPTNMTLEAPVVYNVQTGTSYTLVLTDAGRVIEMNNAAANTLTVPTDASVNFPIGTVIDIFQTGAGQTTVGGAGVTINARPGLKLSGQWATATLIKRAANTWLLTGSLSA